MRKFRGEKAEAHYERNAIDGRTSRMHITLDMRHIGTSDRTKLGLPTIEVSMADVTLTPEDTATVFGVMRKYVEGYTKTAAKTQDSAS